MQNVDQQMPEAHDAYPNRHFTWTIMSSAGVVSRLHMDTGGLATASRILHGEKIWVLAEPIRRRVESNDLIARTDAFGAFRDNQVDDYHFRYEAMSLRKNDVL